VTTPRPEASINGAAAIEAALVTVDGIVGADARRVFGWATVDTDRLERELRPRRSWDLPDDPHLGARCRLLASEPGRPEIVLLEPVTEGLVAASLARFGEGAVVVYVVVPAARFRDLGRDLRASGLILSGESPGPFGRQHLVSGAPRWGAHLLIAEDGPIPPRPGAATIER
jgi:hypothetical protein